MDIINIDTGRILFSKHVPETAYETAPWVNLREIDFSAMGINPATNEGRETLKRTSPGLYVIENLVARWKTSEEMYDLKFAQSKKLEQLKNRTLTILKERAEKELGFSESLIIELFTVNEEKTAAFFALLALTLISGQTISTNDVFSQYIELTKQIEATTDQAGLDKITIP